LLAPVGFEQVDHRGQDALDPADLALQAKAVKCIANEW
jgi:hypothetical protein